MAAVGRIKWSWLYLFILLWMVSLTIPTFQSWQRALAEHRGEEPDPNTGWGMVIALALGTIVLGFAIGWPRRWTTLWSAVGLGALVMSVGVWVDYNHSWSGGEPMPEPGPFLMNSVILSVLLWVGCGTRSIGEYREASPPIETAEVGSLTARGRVGTVVTLTKLDRLGGRPERVQRPDSGAVRRRPSRREWVRGALSGRRDAWAAALVACPRASA